MGFSINLFLHFSNRLYPVITLLDNKPFLVKLVQDEAFLDLLWSYHAAPCITLHLQMLSKRHGPQATTHYTEN
jgi:hypothetical protein